MRLFVGSLLLLASSVVAAPTEVKILVDSDKNIATGCRVFTAAGNFDGVEQIFTTTFDTTSMTVSGVVRQQCTDPITATFGSPITVDASGWAVGTSGGNFVLETHIPTSAIGGAHSVRLGFTATSGTLADAMLQQAGGGAIVFTPDFAIPGRHHAVWPASGRAITRDGNISDWDGIGPLVRGSSISSSPSLRFTDIRASEGADDIAFLFLIQANPNAPTANPETFSVLRGGTLNITPPGILANDTDPHGLPLTALLISGTEHGTLTVNANGSFTYTNDGSNAPVDSFRYKASNGTQTSNTANDTINILTGTPPTITSGNTATFTVGASGSFTVTATGNPAPTLSRSGALPTGVTFNTATGVLSGTPAVGTGGSYPITFTATNAAGTANQNFTLNVNEGPAITSANNAHFTAGVAANFIVTTSGFPRPTITETGALPGGVTFTNNGNGTATIGGIPANGSGGVYTITINASNVIGPATPQTFTITVCNNIAVTNPAVTTGTAGTAFSQTFTQTGAVGTATFTTASALPAGFALATNGTLSGTTTTTGTFPITVTVTDSNGCTGVGPTYNLVINCAPITVTNPATTTGTANSAFSQTFTQTGAVGGATFTTASALPSGLTLAANGTLAGTPTVTGTFPIVVTVTGGNGCTGTGAAYNLVINCQTITVTNPATTTGTAGTAFSQTFTQTGAIGGATFTTASALPAGMSLATNGTLAGTPTVTGSFPIVVKATDANGCFANGATYNLTIGCQAIAVSNPGVSTGTTNAAFSQAFTQNGAIGTATFTTASTLPTGFTLSTAGVLSGTTQQHGTFPIVVKVTDGNGCQGTGATYNLVINCQTITVTNPANANGTVSAPFSEQFTQSGAIGGSTFTTASSLPSGLSLSAAGLLAGTPLQAGTFPVVVTVTDANGCTGTGATYNLVIACQVILVGNPATTSSPAGAPLSINFTQTGAVGGATFTTASTLPTGLTLAANGTLSGTPTQGGAFPISVTVTDGNGCTGVNPAYTLTITCPTITVTNPANATGTAGTAFSEQFTQAGGAGTITWSETGALPTGITLNTTNGILSGTTSQVGLFPITVTATDQNGCTGTGATYNLTFNCQTVSVTNPGVNTGTVDAAFSQTFTATGILGTPTWTETGALPAGITLNSSSGVLSGTPTVTGSFPITVKATDTNGCFNTSSYTLTISCQTINVANPGVNTGTVDAPFSQTFTQTGAHGTATFTTASTLPAGLTLSAAGVLSGAPTVTGSFPIVVTVTDSNGCTGTGATYTLTINCQTINVTNPSVNTGTVGTPFGQNFTQSGAHGTATFTTASTLPSGFTLSTAGVLSGTTNQFGTFPIVVTVTDANGCTGTGTTYNLTINCQTIVVTNPGVTSGTVASPFSQQFTQSGAIGGATFNTASTLPTGLTFHSATGILDGTPTQSGSFPIVVTVTDGNGCTGTGSTYNLVIACNTITVTSPANSTGTAGVSFNEQFTQSGGNGTITWSVSSGTLPTGITLNTSNGTLFGTTTQAGTFPLTLTATDANGCTGTSATYNLTINCQTITITNPGTTSVQAGSPLSATFTATGILGTPTWSKTGGLPTGITLNASSGLLSGTTTQQGTFPITVTVTDTNGCSANSPYTLTVTCPIITVARTGGGPFPAGTIGTAYAGQSFTGSGGTGPYTFALSGGTFPNGLTLNSNGTITNSPTATGTFAFNVTATDANGCVSASTGFSIAINPFAGNDSYSNLVNNTQAVVTGGNTASPSTPFVPLSGTILANDLPAGGSVTTSGTTGQGGTVVLNADGTFLYTPPVTASALTTDSFTYTLASDTGGTGTPTTANGTVTLNLSGRVWYVKNDGADGNGQSQTPFNTLTHFAGARVDTTSDIIFVYTGNGGTTGQDAGITLLGSEQLIGQGVALVVNTNTLVTALTKPQITNTTLNGDVVTLAAGNVVSGLTITGATGTGSGIQGNAKAGFTGDTLTIQNNTGSGFKFTGMTGTITITNATITNNGVGLNIDNGTAAITVNNTNSITANAGQRSVQIQNRPVAAGAIAVGATINDSGTGMSVSSNSEGAITFTGSQTYNTTTNAAVTLSTNAAAAPITFSGPLSITTTTGNGFSAAGGGTVSVTGTTNVTTGAAGFGVNLSAITVGVGGITFNSVNTTGAAAGIGVQTVSGLVTVNGGTITNGARGILITGGSSNLTIANVTITGSTTAAITTNGSTFGTLTIGSSVSISGATALDLGGAGTVNGTFASVTSTGGTNGVNLVGVGGNWGATTGSLSGASGATFNVSGGGAVVAFGATIAQANNAATINVTNGHTGTLTFSANITATNGTGLQFDNADGTYNINNTTGALSLNGGDAGIDILNGSGGSFTFGSGGTPANIGNTTAPTGTAFTVNGSTPSVVYNGNITKNAASAGLVVDITNQASNAITFQNGTITNSSTAGTGINLNNADGTVNFNGTTTLSGGDNGVDITTGSAGTISFSGATITNPSGTAFNVNGSSAAVTYNGSITKNGTSAGLVVDITSQTTGTITFQAGTVLNSSSAGTGINLNNVDSTVNFNGTVTLSGGSNGVSINTGSSGTFNFSAGATSITNPGTTAFNVSASAPTSIAYAGSITNNGGRAISISNAAAGACVTGAGSLTFSGNISGSGASATGILVNNCNAGIINFSGATKTFSTQANQAVTLTNQNGVTINFTGNNLNLTTTTAATFTATGGGTINVTGTGNTLTAGTGNALTATSVTLGMTLQSVTASGGPFGIVLTTTSGSLSVTGTSGGLATGTGGSISNVTTRAIHTVNSSGTLSFSSMNLSLNTLADGGVLIDNNTSGNLTANFTGCTFTGVTASVSQNKSLLQYEAGNAATLTANVQNSYFNSSRTYGFFATGAGTSVVNVTVNQCGFGTNVNSGAPVNKPGTTITNPPAFALAVTNGSSAQVDYNITNNTFWGADGLLGAVYAVTISGASTTASSHLNGTISGNQLGKAGTLGSGCANGCAGIGILPGTNGTYNTTVTNNDVRQTNRTAIDFFNSAAGSSATLIGKVTNNTISEPDLTGAPLFQRGIAYSIGNSGGSSMGGCLTVTGNNISGGWSAGSFIRITTLNTTGVLTIPGLSPATGATGAQVDTYIESLNTVGAGNANTTVGGAINNTPGSAPCP